MHELLNVALLLLGQHGQGQHGQVLPDLFVADLFILPVQVEQQLAGVLDDFTRPDWLNLALFLRVLTDLFGNVGRAEGGLVVLFLAK